MTEETVNEIQWTIHTTNPELVQPAREKLSEVVDPEIGMHIIQLGLVRDISIEFREVLADIFETGVLHPFWLLGLPRLLCVG